jgi:methionyl aminopeptidase
MMVKTAGEVTMMDEANRIVHRVLDSVAGMIRPGVTTRELDRCAEREIRAAGAAPAFLNYKGYPATLCTSVNDVIVHGIPGETVLQPGDIVGIDCGVLYNGYYGDAARTFAVGSVEDESQRLMDVTRQALELAVEQVKPGGHVSDIGWAVQRHVEAHGFSVVREFVGHGIGTELHEDPLVPYFGVRGRGPRLRSGMVLAIEPMVNAGRPGVKFDEDGWTARTEDGKRSAHFEYSVAVTGEGARILGVAR